MEYKDIEDIEKFIDENTEKIVEESKKKLENELDIINAIKESMVEIDSSFKEIFEEEEKLRKKDEREIFFGDNKEEDTKKYGYFSEIDEKIKHSLWNEVFNEDLTLLIKQYQRMAFKKSNYLKGFYLGLKELKESKKETFQFHTSQKIEKNKFFRGRYFDNESPYDSKRIWSFYELVQPPKHIMGKGRFNEENQSRFYLANSKLGVYLELDKNKQENKNKDLYIQEFGLKQEKIEELKKEVFAFFKGNEIKLTPVRDDEIGKAFEHISDLVFKEKSEEEYEKNLDVYIITNYIADIVNSIGFKGLEFTGTKLNSMQWNTSFTIKDDKMYKNFVIFSDGWTIHSVEKNMTKYELEAYKEYLDYFKEKIFYASDYFEPVKNYPEKIVIEDVIEEFNELLLIEKYSNNCYIGNRDKIYDLFFDFKKLCNEKECKVFEFMKFDINMQELEIECFPFLIKYKAELKNDLRNEIKFIETFDLENEKEHFNKYLYKVKLNVLGKEVEKETEYEELKDFNFTLKNEEKNIKLERVDFSHKIKRKILTDYLDLFHRLFGVYYNIQIDENFENIKLIKF